MTHIPLINKEINVVYRKKAKLCKIYLVFK